MNHFRLIVLSLVFNLSYHHMGQAAEKEISYQPEAAERAMLQRSFNVHLKPFERDWEEISLSNKGYFYGIYETRAKEAFLSKSGAINDIFYEIFFDPKNPNPEGAKLIADLQAKLMLRYYFNQQCQSIILAYPNRYSSISFSTPTELNLIYVLELLAKQLKDAMMSQLNWIDEETDIEIPEDLRKAIESKPLNHNYHEKFTKQLDELKAIGSKAYLQKLEAIVAEQKKEEEERRKHEETLEKERLKKIPPPPLVPPSFIKPIPYKERRLLEFKDLDQILSASKEKLNPVKKDEEIALVQPNSSLKKKFQPPRNVPQMSSKVLDEIKNMGGNVKSRLKPAGDRILAKMVSNEKENEFLKKIAQRRRALMGSSDEAMVETSNALMEDSSSQTTSQNADNKEFLDTATSSVDKADEFVLSSAITIKELPTQEQGTSSISQE